MSKLFLVTALALSAAGLLMLPQVVFVSGVLLFAAYVAYNMSRSNKG